MVPTVLVTDFPDIIEKNTRSLDVDHPWFKDVEPPKMYSFSLETGTYEGIHIPQPSPLEPGVWFDYPYATRINPEEVCGPLEENQEYYWDKEKETWGIRLNVTNNTVYSKITGELIENASANLRMHYTFAKPKGIYSKYSEEIDGWEIDYDNVIEHLKNGIESYSRELNNFTIEQNGETLVGLRNLDEYATMFNISTPGEKTEFYTSDGDLISLTREELAEVIEKIKIKRSENMNAIKFFKEELKNVNDKESLYRLLTFETRTRTTPSESMVKLSKLIIGKIEGE